MIPGGVRGGALGKGGGGERGGGGDGVGGRRRRRRRGRGVAATAAAARAAARAAAAWAAAARVAAAPAARRGRPVLDVHHKVGVVGEVGGVRRKPKPAHALVGVAHAELRNNGVCG